MYIKKKSKNLLTVLAVIIAVTSLGGLFTLPKINRPANTNDTNPDTYVACIAPNLPELQHIHPKLTIIIDGEQVTIPTDIGIEPGCHRFIHTHDTTGEIHVEAQTLDKFKLADFFSVWGKQFNKNQIMDKTADATHLVRMTVNGQPSEEYGDLILEDKQDIRVEYISIEQHQGPEIPAEVLEQLQNQQGE